MEVIPFAHWRSRGLVEVTDAFALRRGSTHPDVGVELLVGGTAYSLHGHTVRAKLRFTTFLRQELGITSPQIRLSDDKRVRVGDTLVVDDERMLIQRVDAVSDPGYLRLRVKRAVDGTEASSHENGTPALIYVVDRTAVFLDVDKMNRFTLQWKKGDTDRVGDFELEFLISEPGTNNLVFTVPASPLPITISPAVG